MKIIPSFIGLMIIWLLLTWSVDPQELIIGGILSLAISIVLGRIMREPSFKILNPVRWFWFGAYGFYFLYYCFRANLDVAYRALHPDMPIHPGIIKVRTSLTSDVAKTFLANSITLTPGTLTIDIQDDVLFIHWINVTTRDPEEQTEMIIKRFERMLRRIFE